MKKLTIETIIDSAIAMFMLCVAGGMVFNACAKAAPDQPKPPLTKAEFVKKVADQAYAVTVALCGTADLTLPCSPGGLDSGFAHEVLKDTASVSAVASKADQGWEAVVKASWAEAAQRIGEPEDPRAQTILKIIGAAVAFL